MSTFIILTGITVFLCFILFIVLLGWFAFTSLRVRAPRNQAEVRVLSVTEDTVTLPLLKKTSVRGIASLVWQNGDALVGEITAISKQTVTRQIIKATHPLTAGLRVRWNKFVYQGDPHSARGLAYEDVSIPGRLGELPAWLVRGQRPTWVIVVHGFHATREEALRVLPTLSEQGFLALVITYRNDIGAPTSPDHLYHLGDTEWEDVEAGVSYALSHGAQDLVLFGWSMGGCLVETFLRRSSYAAHVRAIVLDSPILNWQRVLEAQVQRMHLPHWCGSLLKWMVARFAHIDFAAFNYERSAGEISIPTLLFHGTADVQVPVKSSDLYVEARSNWTTYRRVEGVDHTLEWNADPQIYEEALAMFLQRVTPSEISL